MKPGEGIIGSLFLAFVFGCVAAFLGAPAYIVAIIAGVVFVLGLFETLIGEKK